MTPLHPRRWGWWKVLDFGSEEDDKSWKVKLLSIEPGKSISKQYHYYRSEHWIIINGTADVMIDGEHKKGKQYDYFKVIAGQTHKIINTGTKDLLILELQVGAKTDEDDIIRLEPIDEQETR